MTGVGAGWLQRASLLTLSRLVLILATITFLLLAARWVDPIDLGLWTLIQALIQYGRHGHLGVYHACHRDVPQWLALDRRDRADRQIGLAWLTSIVVPTLVAAVLLLVHLADLPTFARMSTAPLVAAVLLVAVHPAMAGEVVAYATRRTQVVAQANFIRATLCLLSLPLVHREGFFGFLGAYLIVEFGTTVALVLLQRDQFHLEFDSTALRASVTNGTPMWLAELGLILLLTADRWIVSARFGPEGLGQYFFATQVNINMVFLPQALMVVLAPSLSEEFVTSGHPAALRGDCWRVLRLVTAVMAGITAIALLITPLAFTTFLPGFEVGLGATQVMLIAGWMRSIDTVLSWFVVILRHQKTLLWARVGTALLYTPLAIGLSRTDLGLTGVAVAMAATFLLSNVILAVFLSRVFKENLEAEGW